MAITSVVLNRLDVAAEEVSASTKTLDAGDIGVVQVVTADTTITLPATVVGYTYTIFCGAQGSTAGTIDINVSPNASDKIAGLGLTATDNKDLILTGGRYGDFVTLVGDGVNGWMVLQAAGDWEQES